MSTTIRNFEFINYTSGSKSEIHENLTKVRAHVMHDFFRTQKRLHTEEKLEKHPNNHRSRAPKAIQPGSLEIDLQLCEEEENQERSRVCTTNFPIRSASPGASDLQKQRIGHPISHYGSATTSFPSDLYLMAHDLHADKLDPFDILPVSGDRAMGELLKTHFTSYGLSEDIQIPWLRELNFKWQRNLWGMAQREKGMLHTLLFYCERERLGRIGHTSSVRYLFHTGQAIQAITNSLQDAGPSEVFFMLVSAQANRAVCDRDFATAKIHMKAQRDMALRKEPWSQQKGHTRTQLTMQSFVFRHVLQNNLLLALMTSEALILPSQTCPLPEQWPQKLVQEAHRRTLITMGYFPAGLDVGTAHGIVNELHQLSLLLNKSFVQGGSVGYAASVTSRAIYRLCRLKADLQLDAIHEEILRPVDTSIICSLIFAEKFLQTVSPSSYRSPFPQEISKCLTNLVHQRLSKIIDIVTYWVDDGASLENLLWTLYIGIVTCLEAELACLDWFQNALGSVAARLEICNVEHLEHTLSLFPWMTDYFGDYLQVVGERLGFVSLEDSPRA